MLTDDTIHPPSSAKPTTPHVCLLTSSHPVEYSRFFDREAVTLVKAGFHVTLIGLGGDSSVDHIGGVELVRLKPRRGRKKLGLLREIEKAVLERNPDVCGCLDPWTFAVGLKVRRHRPELKLIYDSTESWPEVYRDRSDLSVLARRATMFRVGRIESAVVRRADAIIETNRTRALRFERKNREVALVHNYPPRGSVSASGEVRKPWLVYTGLISEHRGFRVLVQAFDSASSAFPGALLQVVGRHDPHGRTAAWFEEFKASSRSPERVQIKPWMPYTSLLDFLQECSVGAILLQPERWNDFTGLPNKLFEFMAAGLPVIASDFPEMAAVVRENGCGWLVDPTSMGDVSETIRGVLGDRELCRERGEAGRQAVAERYNWDTAAKVLLSVYRGLLR